MQAVEETRKTQIIEAARTIVENEGIEALTMQTIAQKLDIKAPSLYKHISNKKELEVALIAQGFVEQAKLFNEAIKNTDNKVLAIGKAYREWALEHPDMFKLMYGGPLPRKDLPKGVEDAAALPLIKAVGGDRDKARVLWAFAHGMVLLEIADRFPASADLDAVWEIGIKQLSNNN